MSTNTEQRDALHINQNLPPHYPESFIAIGLQKMLERFKKYTHHEEALPVDVVRVYPYYIRTADEVCTELEQGIEPNLIGVILGVKSEKSRPSPDQVMPIGGNVGDETKRAAAFRELREETTIYPSPTSKQIRRGNTFSWREQDETGNRVLKQESYPLEFHTETPFSYRINRRGYPNKRNVTLSSFLVINPHHARSFFPAEEKDKLAGIELLPRDVFSRVLHTGIVHGKHLVGSSTFSDTVSDVEMSQGEVEDRNARLQDLIEYLALVDTQVMRRKIVEKGKYLLKTKYGSDPIHAKTLSQFYKGVQQIGLIPDENGTRPLERGEAQTLVRQAVDEVRIELDAQHFRKKEVEHAQERGSHRHTRLDGTKSLVRKGREALHRRRKKLPDNTNIIVDATTTRVDQLQRRVQTEAHQLRDLLSDGNYGVDILNLLPLLLQTESQTAKTTHAAITFERFLRDAFTLSAAGYMSEHTRSKKGENTLDINSVWNVFSQQGTHTRLLESRRITNGVHQNFIGVISDAFKFDETYVASCWSMIRDFIPKFGDAIQSQDPRNYYLYQVHEERNEVHAATLPELVYLASSHEDDTVRFEAGRKLLTFFKVLFVKDLYDRAVESGSDIFDTVLLNRFGGVVENKEYISNDGTYRMVEIRSNGGTHVIIDKRPTKSEHSTVRKTFEERPENIKDFHTYSIALLSADVAPELCIGQLQSMVDDFMQDLIHTGSSIAVLEDRNNFNRFNEYIAQGNVLERSGKRTGSTGNLILRRKLKLMVTDRDGNTQVCEFSFYPYDEMPDDTWKEDGFMGWKEKVDDDQDYVIRRVLGELGDAYGTRSLYELFFPPNYYPHVVQVRKHASEQKKVNIVLA